MSKFQDFPYLDSVEPFIVKDWHRSRGQKMKSQQANFLQGFYGHWTLTGIVIDVPTTFLPPGWTVTRAGPGQYVVTHNLNLNNLPGGLFPCSVFAQADLRAAGTLAAVPQLLYNVNNFLIQWPGGIDHDTNFVMVLYG